MWISIAKSFICSNTRITTMAYEAWLRFWIDPIFALIAVKGSIQTTQLIIPVRVKIAVVVSEPVLRKIMEAAPIFSQARNVPFTAKTAREIFMDQIVSKPINNPKARKKWVFARSLKSVLNVAKFIQSIQRSLINAIMTLAVTARNLFRFTTTNVTFNLLKISRMMRMTRKRNFPLSPYLQTLNVW